jgi:hypothetical protein
MRKSSWNVTIIVIKYMLGIKKYISNREENRNGYIASR